MASETKYEERIGEGLQRIGAMTSQQVTEVLGAQKAGDKRKFGEIAVDRGFVKIDVLIEYLQSMRRATID